ncbi:MAG: glycosyltransferase family 39 protein [Bacteroidota bacterium]|nr:glycosyltransferase family 39 protein [Bacteroidota bacterium]
MNKLTDTLKAIYLRHPYLVVLLISISLTLPWITMGEFYTKGEPREATVATYILNTGNWVLPADYADEVAYKPPFMHWFIAAFSLPAGHVTETTARLPSALGLIGITLMFFTLLYKRKPKHQAALAALIVLTSFEMHRSGIEARVDMTLAFFMIAGLFSLFKWEEKGLKGYPPLIPLFLGGAALVKGPVGIILPCLVFGIYLLLLQRYSLWKIIVKNIVIALPALAILLIWYALAYQQGGTHFLNIVYAENFGRFFGGSSKTLGISYDLGHEGPFWYYIPAILIGFLPWSFLLIFSAFGTSYKNLFKNFRPQKPAFWQKLAALDKFTLFSIVSVVVILTFYAIPTSKRSVYIMPAYPFAAYLLTLLYDWSIAKRPGLIKPTGYVIMALSGLILAVQFIFRFVNLYDLVGSLIKDKRTLHDIQVFSNAFQHPTVLAILTWFLLLAAVIICLQLLKRKASYTIVFGTLGLFISLQILLEASAFPVFKDSYSSRPFAEKIEAKYNLKDSTYVTNNLKSYPNLYGLNFYTGNHFKNFEKELPSNGYFISGTNQIDKIRQKYAGRYVFEELERTVDKYNDYNDIMVLYKIVKVYK